YGLHPNLMALGKALGAGVPIGAAMCDAQVAKTISAGDHGTTYGGNLLACRAALVFLDALEGGLLDQIRRVSSHLFTGLRALHALVSTYRDEGRLLPRDLAEITRHADRFVVCETAGGITGCAELAPLSSSVAEVRSLVVAGESRGNGVASGLVDELQRRAQTS